MLWTQSAPWPRARGQLSLSRKFNRIIITYHIFLPPCRKRWETRMTPLVSVPLIVIDKKHLSFRPTGLSPGAERTVPDGNHQGNMSPPRKFRKGGGDTQEYITQGFTECAALWGPASASRTHRSLLGPQVSFPSTTNATHQLSQLPNSRWWEAKQAGVRSRITPQHTNHRLTDAKVSSRCTAGTRGEALSVLKYILQYLYETWMMKLTVYAHINAIFSP